MRASLDRWSQIGASPWVIRVLRFGYRIPWRRPPPPLRRKAYPQPPSDLLFGHKTADQWVASGFVAELPPEEAATAPDVSPTFVIYHPKNRLVVDLSSKNEYMDDRKFQYETLTGYTTQISPGDHLFSWDLKDAFFHIPLAPADQRRLAFRVGNRVFIPLVLPFGLKLAPFVLTKVLRPVVGYLRRKGIAVLAYMDDFCGRPPGKPPDQAEAATKTRVEVLELFRSLGLAVHPTKGEAVGTTRMPILGYVLDTARREITLPDSRLAGLIAAAGALTSAACSASRRVSFKALQRFTGKAVSCSLALPAGRLYLQRLYAAQRGNSHRRSVRLTHGALRDLTWWRSLRSSSDVGRPLWLPRLGVLTTDASPYGWGGHWDDEVPAQGLFAETTRHLHINVKEVTAVTLSLLALSAHCGISEGAVALKIDNTVALYCINSFSSRSPLLVAALRQLYAVAKRLSITISGTWVASVANLRADALSRDRDRTHWRLAPYLFRVLSQRYGEFDVDLFATHLDTHCPTFYSFPASPGCAAIDAMEQSWVDGNLWVNPPFSKIELVLDKIVKDKATGVVILPVWRNQQWWATAMERANEVFLLPPNAGLFSPGRIQTPNARPHWRVAAFRFLNGGQLPPRDGGKTKPTLSPQPHLTTDLQPLPLPSCKSCL